MPDDDPRRDSGFASRDLSRVNAELAAWAGANAIVLGSGLTHRHLRVDLWQDGRQTQLAVLCAGPTYYCGPLIWTEARVRIAPAAEGDRARYFTAFEFRDDNAGVRLLCDEVQLVEEPAISWRKGVSR